RVGNGETGRILPAEFGAGGGDFVVAKRGTVHSRGILLVGRAPADHGLAADQGRAALFLAGGLQSLADLAAVMAVDIAHHLPAVGLETIRRVVSEPVSGAAIDGNAVV